MLFLAILDQINEFDGEFDDAEEMAQMESAQSGKLLSEIDTEMQISDARALNKKASKRRDPNLTSIDLD